MKPSNWSSGELLELSGSYWKTCTLHAGVKLDVFTHIGEDELSAAQLAVRLKADQRALTMLLNALAAMGLLIKDGDLYTNSPAALSYLSKKSPGYLGYIMLHHHHLVDSWSQLAEAVKKGLPVRGRASFSDPERREAFLMGMFNLAMAIAPQIVQTIDLKGRRHLIDVGGGPGTYAIHFCLKNPELRATIYDLPTTQPFAEETVAKFGVSDRVRFLPGNYLEEDIPGSYDVAWLSQILHGEGPEECRMIVRKTAEALSPGGLIFVHEFILDNDKASPLFPALFSLNMLLGTDSGQSYSEAEIGEMLEAAGCCDIRRLPFRGPNESGIIMGVMPT